MAYWIDYLHRRVEKNKNFLCVVYGETGSGKSWSCLSIGEEADKEFNVDHVVFRFKELLDLIKSDKLKKGSVIVWEEAGIDINNRTWQSLTNRLINYLMQTFRYKCFILLFNVPYSDFIDSATRKLFHAEFQTTGIDRSKNQVKLKCKLLQYNSERSKFYRKYLRVKANGHLSPLVEWRVNKPSDALIALYNQKKEDFNNKLQKSMGEQIDKLENADKVEVKVKPMTERQQEIALLLTQYSVEEVSKQLSLHFTTIYSVIEVLKQKGYVFKPIREAGSVIRYEILGI